MRRLFIFLCMFFALAGCSKTAINSINTVEELREPLHTAQAVTGETVYVSSFKDVINQTICNPSDSLCMELHYTVVTSELKGIIIKTTGTNIIENPQVLADLKTVLKYVGVKQTVKSGSYVKTGFIYKPTKGIMQTRTLKFKSGTTYYGAGLTSTSKLTAALLADAAKNPTLANVTKVLEELYNPVSFTISLGQ